MNFENIWSHFNSANLSPPSPSNRCSSARLKDLHEVLHDALIKILTAQVGVSIGGHHLEDTVVDGQQRHVEGPWHRATPSLWESLGLDVENVLWPTMLHVSMCIYIYTYLHTT